MRKRRSCDSDKAFISFVPIYCFQSKTMDTGIVGRGNLFLSFLSALWAYVRSEVMKQILSCSRVM